MQWSFAEFTLDTARYELRRGPHVVRVEPQVFDVLEYLVENHDRVVLKDELIERIWPHKDISEASLNSRVMAARRAIGDDGRSQRYIKTLHGRGFRFVGAVRDGNAAARDESPEVEPAPVVRLPLRLQSFDTPATSFVGRDAEVLRLQELLMRPGCRLVSIVGPGGVGKTRLAAVVGGRLHDEGVEVAFVKCRSLTDAGQLPFVAAAAVGITLISEDPSSELAGRIGDRSLVLILDNIEQVAKRAAGVIAALLSGTSALRVLVTTRHVLGIGGEWVFSLGGLSSGEGDDAGEAGRLFLEREAQALASLSLADLGDASDAALARTCRLVDGMPLALELAAALRRYISREEIAARIERDSSFLAVDLSDLPDRHRRITALLEESVDWLTVEQGRVLLSLSTFEDSFTSEGAQHVAEARVSVLGDLVDRSLLQSNGGRFSLHPLLRQFTREKLGAAAALPLRTSHAEYYAHFLAQRSRAFESAGQAAAVQEIHREFPNILAAGAHAVAEGRLDLVASAAYSFSLYAQIRSRNLEAVACLDPAIALARAANPYLAAELLVYRGWALFRIGRMAQARASAQEAQTTFADLDRVPAPGLGRDPNSLFAVINWTSGNHADAVAFARKAEARAAELGDEAGQALALWIQAAVLLRQSPLEWRGGIDGPGMFHAIPDAASRANLGLAASTLAAANEIVLERGEHWIAAFIATESGMLAQATGDPGTAIRHYQRALALQRSLDNRSGMASVSFRLANLYLEIDDAAKAAEVLALCEPLVASLGEQALVSDLWQSKAMMAMRQRDLPAAYSALRTCVSLALEAGFKANVIAGLRHYAELCELAGFAERALPVYRRVLREPGTTSFSRARCEAALRRLAGVPAADDPLEPPALSDLAESLFGASSEAAPFG